MFVVGGKKGASGKEREGQWWEGGGLCRVVGGGFWGGGCSMCFWV